MGLLAAFRRRTEPAASSTGVDAVAEARTRAKRRLIGATVLLGIAVIAFPLILETQPRPVALDIPIEIPRKDTAVPLGTPIPAPATPGTGAAPRPERMASGQVVAVPPSPVEVAPAAPAASAAASAVGPAPGASAPTRSAPVPAKPTPEIVEKAGQQGREIPPPAGSSAGRPVSAASAAAPVASRPQGDESDADRARALLEGRAASAPTGGRFVVQVGSFTDAAAVREVRQKVERLGVKTYIQVAEVEGVRRTRVRVGPYGSREEADRQAAALRAAGLTVSVLSFAP